MNIFILKERKDRMGSNFIVQIANYIFGSLKKCDIYYSKNHNYLNNIYFIPWLNNCKENNKNLESTIKCYGGIRGNSASCVELLKQDTISYFNENYKDNFYKILNEKINEKNIKLPWIDNKNIICIHVRLDDRNKEKDYDGRGSFNYVKNLINKNKFSKYDRKKSDSCSLDTQRPIDPKKLKKLVEKFQSQYPEKEIYIITYCKKIPEWLKKIVKNYKLKIFHDNNEDYDLWLMINSDILVLSKSTFSIIAGYYHQGSNVYYPYWGTVASLGIGSKYDKSGWIGYV